MQFVKRYGPRSCGRRVDSGMQSPCLHLFAALRANAGSLQSSTSYVLLPRDSSASWSFRCVMCGTHFPRAQRMSPASSILASGTPRACSVSVCFYAASVSITSIRRCLRGPGGSFHLLSIPQEASSLGRMGAGLWGVTLPGLGPRGLQGRPGVSGDGRL